MNFVADFIRREIKERVQLLNTKAGKYYRRAKLNSQIGRLNLQRKSLIRELGELVYSKVKEVKRIDRKQINVICEKISVIDDKISINAEELDLLKYKH